VRRDVAAGATSLLLTFAVVVGAAESPFSRVALLLPTCEQPGLSASELREAVALDLRDEQLTLAPAGELSPTTDVLVRIEAACSAGSELSLHAAFGDARHSRRVDLLELPAPQRARALSLALAELLALFGQPPPPPGTGELSGAAAPATVAPPAPAVVSAPAGAPSQPPANKKSVPLAHPAPPPVAAEKRSDRQPTSPLSAPWRLSLAPQLRFFDTTWLWGGRALAHHGAWSAGIDVLRAQESVQAGSVTTLLVHGTFAYSFAVMGGGEQSALEAGPRLGIGRAFMAAQATASALAYDAEDVYVDAAFTVRYSRRLSPVFRFGLGGELGYAGGPVGYADDLELASTSGAFAALLIDASVGLF
jgi:hypothetical protein